MSTNINLKNSTDTTFSITHSDGANTKVLDSKDIAVAIDTVADFPANPNNGDVVIVRDLNRGGTFIYDSSEVAGSNDGTNFNGWIRQYSGAVNVKWFDDDIQKALNVSGTIELNSNTTYTVITPIEYTGKVTIKGNNAKILSDSITFLITDGANSNIRDIEFDTISTPYTVIRTSLVPSTYTLQYSKDGYQPTVNDGDIWSGLTTGRKNQNIESGILFESSTATQSNIIVSGIKGNFTSIILKDTDDSIVENCVIKAGKNYAGGILFWCLDSGIGSGRRNKAVNNIVKYASYSGIVYANQYDGIVTGNDCSFNGESGIKLWQGTSGAVEGKIARGMIISNNKCYSNFYDGIDAQGTYGTYDALVDMRNLITDNISWFNRQTGLVINGRYNKVSDNIFRSNGVSGIVANNSTDSIYEDNIAYGNNTKEVLTGYHQIAVVGNGNVIKGNQAGHKGITNGYNYYIDGTSSIFGINEQFDLESSVYLGSAIKKRGKENYFNLFNNGYSDVGDIGSNLNNLRTTSVRFSSSDANRPDGNWWHIFTIGDGTKCVQMAFRFTAGAGVYTREYHDSTWSSWVAI